jgi:hypothetical protein
MPQDYTHIIQTKKNGVLDTVTPQEHVKSLVQRAMASGKPIVIHLHGGLVAKESAYKTVNDLTPPYLASGQFPIFIVWRTGLFDALKNADEIIESNLFKSVRNLLIKYLMGKYGGIVGAKSMGSGMEPDNADIQAELQGRGTEAFLKVEPQPDADHLTDQEQAELENRIEQDVQLRDEWEIEINKKESTPLLSQEIVVEATRPASAGQPKGFVSSSALIKNVLQIAGRIIYRYYHHRDHEFHATLVEEILRKLYVGSIGTTVWKFMKTDSADTFEAPTDADVGRGGRLLINLLGEAFASAGKQDAPVPQISIVGHSAGSIYAMHLLTYLRQEQHRPGSPWQGLDQPVDRLVFLAPAITHHKFTDLLRAHQEQPLFKQFRMFSLCDADERGYFEVKVLYPASLLYIISGLLEAEDDEGTADMPLVGMQRYGRTQRPYDDSHVKSTWQFLHSDQGHTVWSGETRGHGLNCDSKRHGAFDEWPSATMTSVIHFLMNETDPATKP